MSEWKNYRRLFYRVGSNIGKAKLWENDALVEGCPNLGIRVFGREGYDRLGERMKGLRVEEFYENNMLKDKAVLEQEVQERISLAEYFRLRNTLREVVRLYGININSGKCIDRYMRVRKRTGGDLRREITGRNSQIYNGQNPLVLPSAITLWGNLMEGLNRGQLEINLGLWNKTCFDASFRQFLFNLVQGRLYLNNVLHRIDNEENHGSCTFCRIIGERELRERNFNIGDPEYGYYLDLLPRETTDHIFWECVHVQECIQRSFRWMHNLDWYRGVETITKRDFFLGNMMPSKDSTVCDITWKHFVKHFIYRCRLRRVLPFFGALKADLTEFQISTVKLNWWKYERDLNGAM
jgi:hypothetical protein